MPCFYIQPIKYKTRDHQPIKYKTRDHSLMIFLRTSHVILFYTTKFLQFFTSNRIGALCVIFSFYWHVSTTNGWVARDKQNEFRCWDCVRVLIVHTLIPDVWGQGCFLDERQWKLACYQKISSMHIPPKYKFHYHSSRFLGVTPPKTKLRKSNLE